MKILIVLIIFLGAGAAQASTGDAANFVSRGDEFLRESNFPHAIEAYRNAIEIDPNNKKAHFKLGVILAVSCYRLESIEHLTIAVKLPGENKIHGYAYRTLGMVYHKLGNAKEAEEAFEQYKIHAQIAELEAPRITVFGQDRGLREGECIDD